MEIRRQLIACFALFSLLLPTAAAEPSGSAERASPALRLIVIDPYAELRTGPGSGYPVFYAVEQGESVDILAQRPGWYELRTQAGRIGWTSTAELARTMQASGVPADLPTVSFGDYLRRSWELGMEAGRFTSGELDGADMFSATAGYKLFSWLDLELELGKILGSEVRGRHYGLNAVIEPFSESALSPFLSLGTGRMDVDSQPKLVPLSIDTSNYQSYSLGSNYYLGRNFVVQGRYRWFRVDTDAGTERLGAWSIGFDAFF